jgi:DNA-binding SARP family transcriptional activator
VLQETARLEARQQHYVRAIEHLRTAIQEDPLHESSYVDLMRYLTLDGRRTEALRVYFDLRTILKKTLDVEPQAQATCLYDAIRAGEAAAS